MQEAEKKSQAQLQALQAEKQAAAEQLKAAQTNVVTAKQQLHTLSADKQAAIQELHAMQGEMQAVKQRLDASDADKAAAAKQLADSKAAHKEERARWQQQQAQWQAERAAKSEKEEQLQRDMAAMQAMLAEYKALASAAQAADKKAALEGFTRSTGKQVMQGVSCRFCNDISCQCHAFKLSCEQVYDAYVHLLLAKCAEAKHAENAESYVTAALCLNTHQSLGQPPNH